MPALTAEFRLYPWDFGGDRCLTYAEADEYLEAMRKIAKQRKEQEKKSRAGGNKGGSGRRGRRR